MSDNRAVPTVQLENEHLRVTEWCFAPGAATGWHSHGFPYFVTMLTKGVLRIHDGKDVSDVSLAAGQAYSRPAGVTHDVMNVSDHPIAFIEKIGRAHV